jgi:TonB family protein
MPRYPRELKERGISGRVELAFVVDRNGVPVPNSLQIISSPDPGFSQAAAEAVLGSRFKAGEIRGCPIPVLVRQAVNFNH